MRTGLTISAVGHTAFLLWGLISFAAAPYKTEPTESMPIDIISAKDFSQLTAGSKSAPKSETSKPLVDKVGERKLADDPDAKVEKKEIKAAVEKPPEPKPPEPKPPSHAEQKPPEPKRDLIAEAIKKEQVKKPEQKKAEAKAP